MTLFDKDSNRIIRTEYPYFIEKYSSITIILNDNIKLAATLWMPKNKNPELIKEEKFATILEYLPYRKADWTSNRDEIRLKYLSGFGYVSLRVDIRGTGNSEGIFDDEYSLQEQSDALEILQWIENQSWSNGKVIIYGKSWGGFNGLQIGFLQPKNLYGIISAYSTDDRYSDDIHYHGGCLTAQEALNWSSQMLIWLSIPPHQKYQGGIDQNNDLLNIWKERLNNLIPLDSYWIKHQNRDQYWRHGSICEDYSKILCPVLLIGGFADLYTDPVFRLINQLKCPKRAIIGPWGHQWPDDGYPGPQISYLEEIVQWLDYYIKNIDNNYQNKEFISIYQLNPNICELNSILKERNGKWIHFNSIPNYPNEHQQRNSNFIYQNNEKEKEIKYYLSFGCLTDQPSLNNNKISFLSPIETGISSGNLLGQGNYLSPDHSIDQREDDGRSITFDSLPLKENLGFKFYFPKSKFYFILLKELFGFPMVRLNLSSNSRNGLICVRLCMIDETTSSSILLSRGILNLTHNNCHEYPQLLNINEIYNIEIRLSSLCVNLPSGCRLRLSFSTSYWPIVWPSSDRSTLTIHFDENNPSYLLLPCLNENYSSRNDFNIPEVGQGVQMEILRNNSIHRFRIFDEINQTIILKINEDEGSRKYSDGLIFDERYESEYQIKKNDHQSAKIQIKRYLKYYYEDQSLINVNIETKSIMFTKENPSRFEIIHQLDISNHNQLFFNKIWNLSFPREFN